jgi:hypothetical protein
MADGEDSGARALALFPPGQGDFLGTLSIYRDQRAGQKATTNTMKMIRKMLMQSSTSWNRGESRAMNHSAMAPDKIKIRRMSQLNTTQSFG